MLRCWAPCVKTQISGSLKCIALCNDSLSLTVMAPMEENNPRNKFFCQINLEQFRLKNLPILYTVQIKYILPIYKIIDVWSRMILNGDIKIQQHVYEHCLLDLILNVSVFCLFCKSLLDSLPVFFSQIDLDLTQPLCLNFEHYSYKSETSQKIYVAINISLSTLLI